VALRHVVHVAGVEHPLLQRLGVGLAVDGLDHEAQQAEVHVDVREAGAGRADEAPGGDPLRRLLARLRGDAGPVEEHVGLAASPDVWSSSSRIVMSFSRGSASGGSGTVAASTENAWSSSDSWPACTSWRITADVRTLLMLAYR
jgi:hypothetical protein